MGICLDARSFVDYYSDSSHQSEVRNGHDFFRDLIVLVGGDDAYQAYVSQSPVRHVEHDRDTGVTVVDSSGSVDFFSDSLGVVVELKSGTESVASSRLEFEPGPAGDVEWNGVRESRPRSWDRNRRVTPFEQAKDYADDLSAEGHTIRYVVVSNFSEIRVYEYVNAGHGDVRGTEEVIALSDVPDRLDRLRFLVMVDSGRMQRREAVSKAAGDLMHGVFKHIMRCWELDGVADADGDSAKVASAHIFLMRLAFLLSAGDGGLLSERAEATGHEFVDWLKGVQAEYMSDAFARLFGILDTPINERSVHDRCLGVGFPYVNGSLFSDDSAILESYGIHGGLALPSFDTEIKDYLVGVVASSVSWREVDPTVFGSMFESLVAMSVPGRRHELGMHYTSYENIHKVIDPLFLSDFESRLRAAMSMDDIGDRRGALYDLKSDICQVSVFDPACGSGNFLVESYKSLRSLESRVSAAYCSTLVAGEMPPRWVLEVGVSTSNFYGVELDPLAGAIARTSLHMTSLAADVESRKYDMFTHSFPLATDVSKNVHVGENAIRFDDRLRDWKNEFTGGHHVSYIVGNPPFVNPKAVRRDVEQGRDRSLLFGRGDGVLDYVCCWIEMASRYVTESKGHTKVAFVATNLVCQGEQPPRLWKKILDDRNQSILFAWQSFGWESESTVGVAQVSVVVIGFGIEDDGASRMLFETNGHVRECDNINAYLRDMDNVFFGRRTSPICDNVLPMRCGYLVADGGTISCFDESYRNRLESEEPQSLPYLRLMVGGDEYVNGRLRLCLWLPDADLDDVRRNHPVVWEMLEACRDWRSSRPRKNDAYRLRNVPHRMRDVDKLVIDKPYLIVPNTTSENRLYVPIGLVDPDVIPNHNAQIVVGAGLYEFGIMSSCFYNAFLHLVGGGLETRYRHNYTYVYNNYVWPDCDAVARAAIESAAQGVLDARRNHANMTLAAMYDGISPVPGNLSAKAASKFDRAELDDLKLAHRRLDVACADAYGVPHDIDENGMLAMLAKRYLDFVSKANHAS